MFDNISGLYLGDFSSLQLNYVQEIYVNQEPIDLCGVKIVCAPTTLPTSQEK